LANFELSGAVLSEANLSNSNLIGANLEGATIDGVDFSNTRMSEDVVFKVIGMAAVLPSGFRMHGNRLTNRQI
jgi:uncharacterized protein YjbI with pentapeptide repeats